jgi:hypothetical protein
MSLGLIHTLSFSDQASPPTHRIVQIKKNQAPERSINGNRSCEIIASRTHPRCGVQRSMLVRPTIGRFKHRDFRINEPQEFPRPPVDHGVVFGIRRPDFSTAAGNSALIAGTKSSRRSAGSGRADHQERIIAGFLPKTVGSPGR